ncbi:hypothetical protein BA724_03335 [Domibacillus iocasae]|uniref:DUF2326 domain-containing protein n=2 Tax=Domibacillus iocasae TaxID=1714016 RepID=A0A1E7DS48_9BACI|nr:hypothetical protein BA724_03335 [Domibacillus iocasae]
MYLNRLRIFESVGETKEIRNIPFKSSLNIVVDDTEDGKGNNVGKTTFLKLIDICLGAKDKKYIWTDNDTGSETSNLKNYINEKKVCAELEVAKNDLVYILKVELYEKGKRYINNKAYTLPAYIDKLNEIFFSIEKPPSFRQLIGKFVRIKQKEDANTFLKYLHSTTTNAEYKNIYDFLFKLSSIEASAEKLVLDQEIGQLEKDLLKIVKLHKFSNIDDIKERARIVRNTVLSLEKKFNSIINMRKYKENLESIPQIKNRINNLNDSIEGALFKISKIEKILSKETKDTESIDESLLLDFYNDVKHSLGSVPKQFDELVDFNNRIKENKISYYQERLQKISTDVDKMVKLRDSILQENKDIISLISEENFSEFERTHKELIEQSEQLGELTKVQEIYEELTEELRLKKARYTDISTDADSLDNLSKFNEYLTQYSYEIFGQRLYLSRGNPFPLKLSNVDDGIGTGHRKTITLLLDIAYVSFINELGLDYPKFFIHDVIETVDEHNLRKIVEFINENDSQFIFAVLNEKIGDYSFIKETDIILRLSEEDKLFKV